MKRKWYDIADAEASALMKSLPPDLRKKLAGVVVTLSERPDESEQMEEWDETELLGLFVGATLAEGDGGFGETALPPEIRLYVANIRDATNGVENEFREEVRTTLLHEIGHYLGLDEDELEARGLM